VPVLQQRLGHVDHDLAERGGTGHGGRHDPATMPLDRGEQRRERLSAVQSEGLLLERHQVSGQPRELAQRAGGQRGRRPF